MKSNNSSQQTTNKNKILCIIYTEMFNHLRVYYAIFDEDKKQELLPGLKEYFIFPAGEDSYQELGCCGQYISNLEDITDFKDVKLDNISEVHVYLRTSWHKNNDGKLDPTYKKINDGFFKHNIDIVKESSNIKTSLDEKHFTDFKDVKLDSISEGYVDLQQSYNNNSDNNTYKDNDLDKIYKKINHVFKQIMNFVKESANIKTRKGCSFHAELQLYGSNYIFDCARLQNTIFDCSSFTLNYSGECNNYIHLLDEEALYIQEGSLIFKNCTLIEYHNVLESYIIHNLTFENCKFVEQQGSDLIERELKFEDCIFTGALTIKNIQAKGVHLNSCIFGAECNIEGNSNSIKLDIYNSIFNKNLRIYKALCETPVNLSNNIFLGDLTLEHCTFNEPIDLCAKFAGGIYLANSRILKGIVTYNTKIIQSSTIDQEKQYQKLDELYGNCRLKYSNSEMEETKWKKFQESVTELKNSYKDLQKKLTTKISFTDYFSHVKKKLNSSSAENHKNRAKTWANLRSSYGLIKSNAIQSHNHIDGSTWHALEMLAQQAVYKLEDDEAREKSKLKYIFSILRVVSNSDRFAFKISAIASNHRQSIFKPIGWIIFILFTVMLFMSFNLLYSFIIAVALICLLIGISYIPARLSIIRSSILGIMFIAFIGSIIMDEFFFNYLPYNWLIYDIVDLIRSLPMAVQFINPVNITGMPNLLHSSAGVVIILVITKVVVSYLAWHVIQSSRLKLK